MKVPKTNNMQFGRFLDYDWLFDECLSNFTDNHLTRKLNSFNNSSNNNIFDLLADWNLWSVVLYNYLCAIFILINAEIG
jgi:hypothetical protein